MTLCTRVTLAAGFAVLLAVLIAVYVVERDNLHDQIDESLRRPLGRRMLRHDPSTVPEHLPLVRDAFLQVVDRDGKIVTTFDDRPLPVTADVIAVARGEREGIFFDADVKDTPVRIYVTSAGQGTALEIGRSLTEVEQALRQLVLTLIAISLAAVVLAAAIGRLVAATAIAPVHRVAEAADTIARRESCHIPSPSERR